MSAKTRAPEPTAPVITLCSSVASEALEFAAKQLSTTGRTCRTFSALPEITYRHLSTGTRAQRLWLRLLTYPIYFAKLALCALHARKGELLIVTSNGFLAPLIAAFFTRFRGAKTIHLLYDLYPDALEVAGMCTRASPQSKILEHILNLTQRHCVGTVYLGEFLRTHAEARCGVPMHSAVIHISADASRFPGNRVASSTQPLTLHYGGQLGKMHDAELLARCVRQCYTTITDTRDLRFQFYLSGARAKWFREAVSDLPVEVSSAIPSYQWRLIAEQSHIGLVTLIPAAASVCLPSKTYAMMAAGMAIIGICPIWSDLGQLIAAHNTGWVVNNSLHTSAPIQGTPAYFNHLYAKRDPYAIARDFAQRVEHCLQDRQTLEQARQLSLRAMSTVYDEATLRAQWNQLVDSFDFGSKKNGRHRGWI